MAITSFLLSFLVLSIYSAHATPDSSDQQNRSAQCSHSQVLILGAGMAGASAGMNLTKLGIHDFRIIEYQDRIGGRTLHTSFGERPNGSSYTIELGTNWITGLHRANDRISGIVNPIWVLAQDVNLTTVPQGGPSLFYDQTGLNDWSNVEAEFFNASSKSSEDADARVREGLPDVSGRVGLQLAGWDSTNDMHKQAAEVLGWDLDAATTPDVSSLIFTVLEVEASIGPLLGDYGRFVVDQRGYDIVTRYLASEYLQPNDPRLVLNSPITKVVYSDRGVTVHTANDTCYSGDYAICTFPLGVLQQAVNGQAPVTFSPPFPKWKAESIFGNVMGIYTKIFYQFNPEDVFWPKDTQNFNYASPNDRGWWTSWETLDYQGGPFEGSGILFATMAFEQSRRIEQQSDEETMHQGLAVLHQMFPNATIPKPKDFIYHRWGMTPWIYGSYSNWANGYTLEQQNNFRANLGRLWFAGEATSTEFFGYLHGAFYEGEFAALEVGACIKNHSSCTNRIRYEHLKGFPESDYNKTSGFQDKIGKIVNHPPGAEHY